MPVAYHESEQMKAKNDLCFHTCGHPAERFLRSFCRSRSRENQTYPLGSREVSRPRLAWVNGLVTPASAERDVLC